MLIQSFIWLSFCFSTPESCYDKQYVYLFGTHPHPTKEILGGKGYGLAVMSQIGLPVPYGFTITTEACKFGKDLPLDVVKQIDDGIAQLESLSGKKFGDPLNPLLVSVRSGAAVSMPGMMDTVLNLGLNPDTHTGLSALTKNPRFAADSFRRFIQMFGDVVMGIKHELFEEVLQRIKNKHRKELDTDLSTSMLNEVITEYLALVKREREQGGGGEGSEFPFDPRQQLRMAIDAVFSSWENPRAVAYRRLNNIRNLVGTAVTVQMMVFGNSGNSSGTGVGFTRNPSTGENKPYGEYLLNAQGEDVVAGVRTPQMLDLLAKDLPEAHTQLLEVFGVLERHFRDMQDIEFTIENEKLFVLQTRSGKRTAAAAIRVAADLVAEGMIDEQEALMRLDANSILQLLLPRLDNTDKKTHTLLAQGLPASPGAAIGKLAFTAEEVAARVARGEKNIILAREETCPDDIEGMNLAQGIITARGGMTSHAAVVARGMGRCCVAGVSGIHIDSARGVLTVGGVQYGRESVLTLDGATGEVFNGSVKVVDAAVSDDLKKVLRWADKHKRLGVRANAETPRDAKKARDFGAEGIGLARTEHMFFQSDRIRAMREMILSENTQGRERALAKLLPSQRGDFIELFEANENLPVNIRLLDPPLHEFLPQTDAEMAQLAADMNRTADHVRHRCESLREVNPMLGFRGCRLGVVYPEITRMQVRAIVQAAGEVVRRHEGFRLGGVEIMVPVLAHAEEMRFLRGVVEEAVQAEMEVYGLTRETLHYTIGVMVELPRACLQAKEIAQYAEFFSFGTNDLTQTTLGYSRDDSAKFTPQYIARGIYDTDPFQNLDQAGVGELVKMGVTRGRAGRASLKCGVCGEHGGDPASIDFINRVGVDYVSCSPFRVPGARIAAAQAVIRLEREREEDRRRIEGG